MGLSVVATVCHVERPLSVPIHGGAFGISPARYFCNGKRSACRIDDVARTDIKGLFYPPTRQCSVFQYLHPNVYPTHVALFAEPTCDESATRALDEEPWVGILRGDTFPTFLSLASSRICPITGRPISGPRDPFPIVKQVVTVANKVG